MAPAEYEKLPPPYAKGTILPSIQHNESWFVDTIQKEMYRQRSIINCDPRHGERIKNFVLFVLAIDYGVTTNASLTRDDYTHFAKMNSQLADLRDLSIFPASDNTKQRRQDILAWQTENLFHSCMTIGFPPEFLIEIVIRFFYFATASAAYMSCVRRIAYYHGLPGLAQKLYFDRNIIIPSIIADANLRKRMFQQLDAVASEYFQSVNGVSSSLTGNDTRAKFRIHYTLKRAKGNSSKRAARFHHVKAFASRLWRKVSLDSPEKQVIRKGAVVGPEEDCRRQAPLQRFELPEPTEDTPITLPNPIKLGIMAGALAAAVSS